MPHIIADTYEIGQQIGAGGGGIVYLGQHVRLGKKIVLKADKRTLSAKPETLRREVDALKNLSHTYIPQVYDFIADGDTVYTVMDYIEGESLDKALKRGQRYPQPQVIEWACELLDALCYLHSRPPHGILHSDIKPANIMLTPQGDIRLIDFNIALALGEDGAIRVGYSQGYASPEHYGLDYSRTSGAMTVKTSSHVSKTGPYSSKTAVLVDGGEQTEKLRTEALAETERLGSDEDQARRSEPARSRNSSQTSGEKTILLDVRSDIYSLGATLYHLLTGVKPAKDAKEVIPISRFDISPALAAVIEKSMAPNPNDRYQTAAEMLWALQHLHDSDPRTVRHKRRMRITAAVLAALFLAGGASALAGQGLMRQAEEDARLAAEEAETQERAAKEAEERARAALAAVNQSEAALKAGDTQTAVSAALEALSNDTPYSARAQLALTDALGVYDLRGGFKSHLLISLDREPIKAVFSPEGGRIAVLIGGEIAVADTETGQKLVSLPADPSALSDVVFPNEDTLLYAGEGALRTYSLAGGEELWTGLPATAITLSGDGKTAAAVYKDQHTVTVYDTATGAVLHTLEAPGAIQQAAANDIFADPESELFSLNEDGTRLAASFAGGGLMVFDLTGDEDLLIYQSSEFSRFEGGFFGDYLAYSAGGDNRWVFAVIDVPGARQVAGSADTMPFHVQADASGIYLSNAQTLVRLDLENGAQEEVAYTEADITAFHKNGAYTIVAAADDSVSIFGPNAVLVARWEEMTGTLVRLSGAYAFVGNLDSPSLRLFKLEDHAEVRVFSYDPAYDHSEARLSADGKTVMLYRYDRFRLYGIDGQIITDADIPDPEQVYDQQYRREDGESRLEVTYNSGLVRTYSAADGSLISEVQGERPDETMYQEYVTDHLRIEAPLHGTAMAYDRETGELVAELEPDAYLAYVTQIGEYVITEYITAEGERYGLLINDRCEALARLPDLCDIMEDGRLIFDDTLGNLRQSRVYSLQELTALAKQ